MLITICLKLSFLLCERGFCWQNLIELVDLVRARLRDLKKTTDGRCSLGWRDMVWGTAAGHLEGTQRVLVLFRSPLCTFYLDAKMIDPLYLSFSHVCVPYAGS